MKACPICNRTFEDTFTFCLIDGSVLSAPFDPERNKSAPRPREGHAPQTEVMNASTVATPEVQPLQSTIRSPVPHIPALHEQPAVETQITAGKNATFTWLLGGRAVAIGFSALVPFFSQLFWILGVLGILTILLSGLLTGVAGVMAQSAYQRGKVLMIDGVLSIFCGLVAAALLASENYVSHLQTRSGWEMVTGILLIGAAIELRKHISRTIFLALAGLFSVLAGLQVLVIFF